MLIRPLINFLGVQELNDRTKKLVQKAVLYDTLQMAIFVLSQIFFMLFVIDTVGLAQLGVLLAISFIIQAVIDYPSGVFGDWIGQRWLLGFAYTLNGFAFAILTLADSFFGLLIVYILIAIGQSQISGTLQTWLDNNYKVDSELVDPQREIYKFFTSRWRTITFAVTIIFIIIGSFLSTLYGRQLVFFIQSLGFFLIAILFFFTVKDFPEIERPVRSVKNYLRLTKEGFNCVFLNRPLLFIMLGLWCSAAAGMIWFTMIRFILYFSYTGSDAGASIVRSIILILGVPLTFLAAKKAKKTGVKWLPFLKIVDVGYFISIALVTLLYPVEVEGFILEAIFLLIIIHVPVHFKENIEVVLQQRVFLDLIPDRNRNAVYSLIPTMVLFLSVPAAFFGGIILEESGIPLTVLLLGIFEVGSILFYYIAVQSKSIKSLDQINEVDHEKTT